jgi:hypothetical protein
MPPTGPAPGEVPPPEPPKPQGVTFGEWYKHHPLAWVGTGLAVLGLGMGIGGGVGAMQASSAANSDVAAVTLNIGAWNAGCTQQDPAAQASCLAGKTPPAMTPPKGADVAYNGMPPHPGVCSSPALTASPGLNRYFGGACAETQNQINHYHTDVAVMAAGWVLFGIGVVGTVAYTFVDWYPKRSTGSGRTEALPRAAVVPLVTPGVQGLGVLGTF